MAVKSILKLTLPLMKKIMTNETGYSSMVCLAECIQWIGIIRLAN